jgi:hypothetical protein
MTTEAKGQRTSLEHLIRTAFLSLHDGMLLIHLPPLWSLLGMSRHPITYRPGCGRSGSGVRHVPVLEEGHACQSRRVQIHPGDTSRPLTR